MIQMHPAVRIAWSLANGEALAAGSRMIEPVHFLLATLKLLAPDFREQGLDAGLSQSLMDEVCTDARSARPLLGNSDADIRAARRALRRELRSGAEPLPQQSLHRSDASRRLLDRAAARAVDAQGGCLSTVHLLSSLLQDLPQEARPFLGSQARPGSVGRPTAEPPPTPARGAPTPTGTGDAASWLTGLGRDLVSASRRGRLAPVLGRRREMTLLARLLHRTSKRNVLLVGAAGVGKTAVVEGLAMRIASGQVPERLRNLRILQIALGDLLAGTQHRGDLEARLQRVVEEAVASPDVVLFLDEIHLAMGAHAGGSPVDVANLLKPALARDEFRCIGATTDEEFDRHVRGDAAFVRRFQVLRVESPARRRRLRFAAPGLAASRPFRACVSRTGRWRPPFACRAS